MPNKYVLFEAEKRVYDTEDPQYDIYWDKNGDPNDYVALFEKLVDDVNKDENLLRCWHQAYNNILGRMQVKKWETKDE